MATGMNEPIQATAASEFDFVGHAQISVSRHGVYLTSIDKYATVGLDFTASEARALASALDSAADELERQKVDTIGDHDLNREENERREGRADPIDYTHEDEMARRG